jgi:SAM-dependent methyltransferase
VSLAAENTQPHQWGTDAELFGPRHEHRLAMFLRETAKLAPRSRILDAAAGLGTLAAKLARQGHRVAGLDSSFRSALHARRVFGVAAVVGDMTRLPFRSGVFDAVTSGETLEHLESDAAAAAEIARLVREGGEVVVTVPALESLRTEYDDYYGHLRRYSRDELAALFERAGLDVVKVRFWGFPVGLVYERLVLVPMSRRRARTASVEADSALSSMAKMGRSRLLVHAVRAIFSIDRLFSFVPYGPGLLLVARKREGA